MDQRIVTPGNGKPALREAVIWGQHNNSGYWRPGDWGNLFMGVGKLIGNRKVAKIARYRCVCGRGGDGREGGECAGRQGLKSRAAGVKETLGLPPARRFWILESICQCTEGRAAGGVH